MTKTKVIISKGYDKLKFEFDDYDEATNFIWTALYTSEVPIAAEITLEKDGDKETETSEE